MLVVALDDRRMRFEVGYGLEGAVPDALARRIIAETIAPRFYEGDYAGGLDAGLDALIGLIDGEPLPVPVAREPEAEPFAALPVVLMLALFAAPLFRRLLGSLFGSLALGAGAGFIVWLVSSVLFASLLAGGVVFVLALTGIGGNVGRWASRGGRWGGADARRLRRWARRRLPRRRRPLRRRWRVGRLVACACCRICCCPGPPCTAGFRRMR